MLSQTSKYTFFIPLDHFMNCEIFFNESKERAGGGGRPGRPYCPVTVFRIFPLNKRGEMDTLIYFRIN